MADSAETHTRAVRIPSDGHARLALMLRYCEQHLMQPGMNRHLAILATLPFPYIDDGIFQIDVSPEQILQLGAPETREEREPHHPCVAPPFPALFLADRLWDRRDVRPHL